jgi:PTS system nitrogen regulatory IIA component
MQLTVRDAARILNVSEKSIYRWIDDGTLPAYRVNHQYRFNRAELLEWATSRKINFSPEMFVEKESQAAPLPRLADALQAGGVHYRVGGSDRESVLRAIIQTTSLPHEVDRDFVFQLMLAREALDSTGVGDGIAIPHVRNPIVLHVERPTLGLCFLEKPVEFGALDGQPVHTLFSLISPTVRAHLHLLSRLAFMLRDPDFKAVLLRQGSREDIFETLNRVESLICRSSPSSPPQEIK